MIHGILLDIDGVIIGGKPGFNFPFPHPQVTQLLRNLNRKGIVIALCTAKPGFAIKDLVHQIGLDGIHISNGGAEIINHLHSRTVELHHLGTHDAKQLIRQAKQHKLYTEAYTTTTYALEDAQYGTLTDINVSILNTKPIRVPSLEDFVTENQITKIMHAAYNSDQKQLITQLVAQFPDLQLQWGGNPMYAPTLFGVVTQKGVTKQSGARSIADHTKIDFRHMLGVGDGLSDWEFMQLCGYVATVENADKKLKELVRSRGAHGYIGPSVDDNGITKILSHFYKEIQFG